MPTGEKKRLVSILPGYRCVQTYPCIHPGTTLLYSDGTKEIVTMSGSLALSLCKKHAIPLPDHWEDELNEEVF